MQCCKKSWCVLELFVIFLSVGGAHSTISRSSKQFALSTTKDYAFLKDYENQWSDWDTCNRACGEGIQRSTRSCNNGDPTCKKTRYRTCKIKDCPDESDNDMRLKQCQAMNGFIPFKKHPTTWTPAISKLGSCELHCSPKGRPDLHYTLSPVVVEGTPCSTSIFHKRLCVNNNCRDVGCDGIIRSSKRFDSCGICGGTDSTCRVESNIFSESFFDHGPKHVTTIPAKASRIDISIQGKVGKNLLGIRQLSSNSQLKIGIPGDKVKMAGTTFVFWRSAVQAHGPLEEPVEIIINIQDVLSPQVVYNYTLPMSDFDIIEPDEEKNDIRQEWKNSIIFPSNKWSLSKFKVKEDMTAPSDMPEQTKEQTVTKYYWKTTGYTDCSEPCGGGIRKKTIVCSSDKGETVNFIYCREQDRPRDLVEKCNLHDCPPKWTSVGDWSICNGNICENGTQHRQMMCIKRTRNGIKPLLGDACPQPPPEREVRTCFVGPCPRWIVRAWSPCSQTCGEAHRTRDVYCSVGDPLKKANPAKCSKFPKPTTKQNCNLLPCYSRWYTSPWSECSEECGDNGYQHRNVTCLAPFPGVKPNCEIEDGLKPPQVQPCKRQSCGGNWFEGPWSKCSAKCGHGNRTREIVCIRDGAVSRDCDEKHKPRTWEPCHERSCYGAEWFSTAFDKCSSRCGWGIQYRNVTCLSTHTLKPSPLCDDAYRPSRQRVCKGDQCSNISMDTPNSTRCTDHNKRCRKATLALCMKVRFQKRCCKTCESLLLADWKATAR